MVTLTPPLTRAGLRENALTRQIAFSLAPRRYSRRCGQPFNGETAPSGGHVSNNSYKQSATTHLTNVVLLPAHCHVRGPRFSSMFNPLNVDLDTGVSECETGCGGVSGARTSRGLGASEEDVRVRRGRVSRDRVRVASRRWRASNRAWCRSSGLRLRQQSVEDIQTIGGVALWRFDEVDFRTEFDD